MANQTVAKTAPVKAEEKKAATVKEEKKAATPAAEAAKAEKPAKKETVKKETVKKEAAKKATAPKKEKREAEATVYVQYQDAEIEPKKVLEQVKADWVNAGHRASSIKKVDLYIKPEEAKAYWVINEKETGSVDL